MTSNKNVVEAHKWTAKTKTLCVELTKGKTVAFHKQNQLNGPGWQMKFRNQNGHENEGFPMKNGRPSTMYYAQGGTGTLLIFLLVRLTPTGMSCVGLQRKAAL